MNKKVFSAVKAVIKNNKDEILFLEQHVGKNIYFDLPGGKVDYGESPYDILIREVKEETTLDVEVVRPIGMWWFFRDVDGHQVVCNTFICEIKEGEVDVNKNPADEEIKNFRWIKKEDFLKPDYIVSNKSLKNLIEKNA
ncbi:MAG: hypothetical protein COU27_00805 [Candidatus Levybacteria bacterium CG10_big_fil_rev_8_21_14_0_10_36_7]|nr:MAG: hypothetical protein COU27_00805 [Candidatus Levybacteria bacterium CG10_big_fil_rev_8_21_14_0_10_36_7]